MAPIKVVCGIIWKGERVLIARRKMEKSLGGYWEFPGGKIELNEDPEDSLRRELLEEIGLRLNVTAYLGSHIYNYDLFSIELLAYEGIFESATFILSDHDAIDFVLPQDMKNYKIAPADLFFVNKLNNLHA